MRIFGGSSDGLSMVAELMASAGRAGADKCILTSFGKLGNGGSLFRVRQMHIHSHVHHILKYIHICTLTYIHVCTLTYIHICMMVDNICYMSVYSHPSNVNEKCPAARTLAFTAMAAKAATDNEEKFYEGWKSYRASNPVVKEREGVAGDDSETDRIMELLVD